MGGVSVQSSDQIMLALIIYRMKRSKTQYDDRVIEARWDFEREGWRLMRLRDDKPDGNHRDVVEKVVQTILDPVSKEDVGIFRSFCFSLTYFAPLASCEVLNHSYKFQGETRRATRQTTGPAGTL